MFGRRRREREAAQAAEEAERRALFEQLARRPDTVCPFLGLAADRVGYQPGATPAHRCYAFGDPAELSAEQQTRVCLERGYGNCPRYLRGVLVIPTEEIEALRRPSPLPDVTPSPPRRRRRRAAPLAALAVGVVLLAGAIGGGALFLIATGRLPIGQATPTPGVVAPGTPAASPTPVETPVETDGPTLAPTPLETPTPEPTPEAADVFTGYEVTVAPGSYRIYRVAASGARLDTRTVLFDGFSLAEAAPRESGGVVHWLVLDGVYSGYSYIAPDSGEFAIRAVFRGPEGERRSYFLPDDELDVIPDGTPAPQPAP